MNIALIGATGFVGSSVLEEALSRGHQVTAISRHPPNTMARSRGKVIPKVTDVNDIITLSLLLRDQDAVISAFNPGWSDLNIYSDYKQGYKSILQAAKQAKVKHILVVGGASSLVLPSGKLVIDSMPDNMRPGVKGPFELLDELRKDNELNWSFISPPLDLTPGGKIKKYRIGTDSPMTDEKGESHISVGDLAVAIVDEIEKPRFIHRRFTVGY